MSSFSFSRWAADAAIRPLMAQHDAPGTAVAVTSDGRTTIFNYGVASRVSAAHRILEQLAPR